MRHLPAVWRTRRCAELASFALPLLLPIREAQMHRGAIRAHYLDQNRSRALHILNYRRIALLEIDGKVIQLDRLAAEVEAVPNRHDQRLRTGFNQGLGERPLATYPHWHCIHLLRFSPSGRHCSREVPHLRMSQCRQIWDLLSSADVVAKLIQVGQDLQKNQVV
ncbi:hypothetical protein AERO9AM_50044 [Aeromicrobium sp. 9AM]|nr:hypothetical protein AERO9AM_50044 [Aeromicrobium sp. 9AM]